MWIPRRASVAEQSAILQRYKSTLLQYERAKAKQLSFLSRLNMPVYFGYHAFRLQEDIAQLRKVRKPYDVAEHVDQVDQEEQDRVIQEEQERRREASRQFRRFKAGKVIPAKEQV